MNATARAAAAGCCATFVGVGLQRFAYSPLLPAMIHDGWLGAGAGGELAAANIGAYLVGALGGPAIAQRLGTRRSLRLALLTVAASFALCAIRGSLAWFLPWRCAAGVAGGLLMVVAGPAVQRAVAPERRGLAGGFTFAGVGLGVIGGAALVPLLLGRGLAATWLGLCAAALLCTALAWRLLPDNAVPAPPAGRAPGGRPRDKGARRMIIAYALGGAAAAPHMLWWADYVARGLGQGSVAGARSWMLWGVAAVAGATLFGRLAGRHGAARILIAAYLIQAIGLALPLLTGSALGGVASVACAGATAVGITALVLIRARELAGEQSGRLWSVATAAYGAAQTGSGFALAALYTATGSHLPLFGFGLAAGLAALPFLDRGQAKP